jgi:hypothetical protein
MTFWLFWGRTPDHRFLPFVLHVKLDVLAKSVVTRGRLRARRPIPDQCFPSQAWYHGLGRILQTKTGARLMHAKVRIRAPQTDPWNCIRCFQWLQSSNMSFC